MGYGPSRSQLVHTSPGVSGLPSDDLKHGDENIRHLIPGQLSIYRRRSHKTGETMGVWQARFKLPMRPGFPDEALGIRKSTGFKNEGEAEQWARNEFFKIRTRWQENQPLEPKKFSAVYFEYHAEQSDLKAAGDIAAEKLQKIEATYENHLRGYFGDTPIIEVDETLIKKYQADRMLNQGLHGASPRKPGAKPSADTVNRENGVLRGMFEMAFRKRYIVREPKVRLLPRKNDKREDFKAEDWEFIVQKLGEEAEAFREQFRTLPVARDLYKHRLMLKALVQLIGYSGVRAGRESNQNLRWRHIKVLVKDGEQFTSFPIATEKDAQYESGRIHHLEIFVPKVKWRTTPDPRTAIGIAPLESPLRRWRMETDFPAEDDFVFCHQKTGRNLPKDAGPGAPIHSFRQQFRDFLERHGLLIDGNGKHRTLTSCRHTYATQRLIHSTMGVYELAMFMGTSIKMIEKIYGHVVPRDVAERAAKLPLQLAQKDIIA